MTEQTYHAADWRGLADWVKDYPDCENCGKPYGNAYFGAAHATGWKLCGGYVPKMEDTAERFH